MEKRSLLAEIAEGFDALANIRKEIGKDLPDAEMQTFMAELEQSLKEAQAGIGRVTTPEQIKSRQVKRMEGKHEPKVVASDFAIGDIFYTCESRRWRCTDVGTRTILAIELKPELEESWFNGPPYAVVEVPFDEYDLDGICRECDECGCRGDKGGAP